MGSEAKIATAELVEKYAENEQTFDADGVSDYGAIVSAQYRGTAADKQDMLILGRKQVLRVSFGRNKSICADGEAA